MRRSFVRFPTARYEALVFCAFYQLRTLPLERCQRGGRSAPRCLITGLNLLWQRYFFESSYPLHVHVQQEWILFSALKAMVFRWLQRHVDRNLACGARWQWMTAVTGTHTVALCTVSWIKSGGITPHRFVLCAAHLITYPSVQLLSR